MSLATQTFAEIAGRYARIMGRNSMISVHFGPFQPMATADAIFLPQLPAGTLLKPHEAKKFNGYLDHETGHHRFTDMNFYLSTEVQKDDCTEMLTNIFEDIRMENAQIDRYPGSKIYLDYIAQDATARMSEAYRDEGFSKNKVLFVLIGMETFKYRGLDMDVFGGMTLWDFDTLRPIAKLMQEYMPTLKSTRDAHELAKKVRKYIEDNQEEIKEEMDQKGTQQQSQGEQDDQGSGSGDSSDSDSQPMPGGPSRQSKNLPDFLNEEQESKGGSPGQLTREEYQKLKEWFDKGTQLQELLSKIMEENDATEEEIEEVRSKAKDHYEQHGSRILPPLSTVDDEIWTKPEDHQVNFSESLGRVGRNSSGAQNALRLFLQSRESRGYLRGTDYGELDMTDPLKVKQRARDRYAIKRLSVRVNTDVLIVIDMSGSMPHNLTMDAAVGICETLKPIQKINLAVAGFYTTLRSCTIAKTPTMEYGRANPMVMPLFKDFHEPYHRAKFRLGSLRTNGLTPLGEAYGKGLEKLAVRRTPRRILWLITDGMPYFDRGSAEHSDFFLMKHIQNKAASIGITTVGTEIGNANFLHRYVQVCSRIEDIEELTQAMFEMTRAFLGKLR